jgi:hypothetical protein
MYFLNYILSEKPNQGFPSSPDIFTHRAAAKKESSGSALTLNRVQSPST